MNIKLPNCPCGSGKYYEKCCYKQKGEDGEPLFYKGAMQSFDAGMTWHPIPNIRFQSVIVGKTSDKYRQKAIEIVNSSKLVKKITRNL